jgi:hypothetical protein
MENDGRRSDFPEEKTEDLVLKIETGNDKDIRKMFKNFKLFPVVIFGLCNIQCVDGKANELLWWKHDCTNSLKECRSVQERNGSDEDMCETFKKEARPIFCRGTNESTGFNACVNITKNVKKENRNRTDPKTDPCAAAVTVCMEAADKR